MEKESMQLKQFELVSLLSDFKMSGYNNIQCFFGISFQIRTIILQKLLLTL